MLLKYFIAILNVINQINSPTYSFRFNWEIKFISLNEESLFWFSYKPIFKQLVIFSSVSALNIKSSFSSFISFFPEEDISKFSFALHAWEFELKLRSNEVVAEKD